MMKFKKILNEKRGRKSLLAKTLKKTPTRVGYALKQGSLLPERLQIDYTNGMKELGWVSKNTTYQELFSNTENE